MSSPEIIASGTVPVRSDTRRLLLVKAINAIGGGGGGSGGSGVVGSGSPEGVVTATPGTTYLDISADGVWLKKTGVGNTGWIQIIE